MASDSLLQSGRGRMLVFARDVASAGATAADLAGAGLPVLQYHKAVPAAERAAALARMCGEEGLVMVCTDAAARGLDVPDVSHVVQVGGRSSCPLGTGPSGSWVASVATNAANVVVCCSETTASGCESGSRIRAAAQAQQCSGWVATGCLPTLSPTPCALYDRTCPQATVSSQCSPATAAAP